MNRSLLWKIFTAVLLLIVAILTISLVRSCHEMGEQPQGGDDEVTQLLEERRSLYEAATSA